MSPIRDKYGESGQILPMMILCMLVLIALVGLALDVGRVVSERTQLVRAVDAAVLAGALQLPDSSAASSAAFTYLTENEPTATVKSQTITSNQVQITGQKNVTLLFGKVLQLLPGFDGATSWDITASATAGFGVIPMDAYMAIDATGSMGASPCNSSDNNSGCPIYEAKQAARAFTNTLMTGSGASLTKIGVGAFRGCYNPPRNQSVCVTNSLWSDLTSNKSSVDSKINAISSVGGSGTNICWALLKAQETLFGANQQTDSSTHKALVILTDGDNTYNNYSYSSGSSPPSGCRPWTNPSSSDSEIGTGCYSGQTREPQLDALSEAMASELKSQGVEVFVVSFGVCGTSNSSQFPTASYCGGIGNSNHDDTADRRLLKCMASSSPGTNDHFFEVPTASSLTNIFTQIAQQLAFRLVS